VPTFAHGIASGDPLADRVVIWTRVTTDQPEVEVTWTVARDPGLTDVVASGSAVAVADGDHTVHVDVSGLEPATAYHYGFTRDSEASPVGRTRTLPGPGATHVRLATVSCAKYNAGYFNGYGRIADRNDLDVVLHLGDYIYEAANKPPPSQTPGAGIGRDFVPDDECFTLLDYRQRYAHYHLDLDVQRLHAAHPIVSTIDDHELADGAWRGGAVEHREDRDGPWPDRVALALQARWEWLPLRKPDPADPSRVYTSHSLGGLARLALIDTRSRRDEPGVGDPAARTALGAEQRDWLLGEIAAHDEPWLLLGNSSVLGHTWSDGIDSAALPALREQKLIAWTEDGPDVDQWDGYPAERDVLLDAFASRGDVVVLSGDVHVALAIELKHDPDAAQERPAGVEFVTASLTSQNLDEKMRWPPKTRSLDIEREFVQAVPNIRWCDLDSHGYVVVDVVPERVTAQWWFVDTLLERHAGERLGATWSVERGTARLVPGGEG